MKKENFNEPKGLNDVAEFHNTFQLPIIAEPKIPTAERCQLRINLLEEELSELKEAINNSDLTEVADALCDIQYVLSGAILEFGLGAKFKSLFDEVHRSNMSKTCKSEEEALATQKHYLDNKNMNSVIKERNGEYLVYRIDDGKVFKVSKLLPGQFNGFVVIKKCLPYNKV